MKACPEHTDYKVSAERFCDGHMGKMYCKILIIIIQ